MDLTKLNPLFLVLVNLRFVLGLVKPPTNVTLECLNMTNIVRWSYDQPLDSVKFQVTILPYGRGSGIHIWVNSTPLEADVSPHIDLKESYLITLNAVIDQNKSEDAPSDGIEFSYIQESMAKQKCFFNLPLVNVSAQPHDLVSFSFDHPFLWHRLKTPLSIAAQKKKANARVEQDLPVFSYQAAVNQENAIRFVCVDRVCKGSLPVNASQEKHCVNITGDMGSVVVVPTKFNVPCVEGPGAPVEQKNYIIYIVVTVALLIAVVIIFVFLFQKKTRPDSKTPNSVSIKPMSHNQAGMLEKENTDQVQVEPSSPTPLLSDQDQTELTPEPKQHCDYEERQHSVVTMEQEDEMRGDLEEGRGPGEDPGYSGRGLEDDFEGSGSSGYEKRPVVVELEPGEKVSAYQ